MGLRIESVDPGADGYREPRVRRLVIERAPLSPERISRLRVITSRAMPRVALTLLAGIAVLVLVEWLVPFSFPYGLPVLLVIGIVAIVLETQAKDKRAREELVLSRGYADTRRLVIEGADLVEGGDGEPMRQMSAPRTDVDWVDRTSGVLVRVGDYDRALLHGLEPAEAEQLVVALRKQLAG